MKVVYQRPSYGIKSAFRDPVTGRKRRHTLFRIINLLLLQISGLLKLNYCLGYPAYLNIEPTNHCNLTCPFCASGWGSGKRQKGSMPLALFKKAIDEISRFTYKVSLYNLGEPFLHNDIFEMINYASKKNISVSLATNGILLDQPRMIRLLDSGCEDLIFSLDAATSETYGKLRQGGDFQKLKENIAYLLRLRSQAGKLIPKVAANFIVTRENESEMADFQKLGESLGVDICSFSLLWKQDLGDSLHEKQTRELLPVSRPEFNRYQNAAARKKSCAWAWKKAVINWDGNVVACCYDYNSLEVMGNIYAEPFKSIWNNRKFRRLRRVVKQDRRDSLLCSQCPSL